MSFRESMFSAGFIQKITKEDLIVKENYEIPPRHRCGKDLEDTTLKLGPKGHNSGLASPLGRPRGLPQSPLALCRLVCIPTIYTIDLKAVLGRFIQR